MAPNWRHRLKIRVKKALGQNIILCDSCKWDWRGACHNSERPNATYCTAYQKKGT